MSSTFLEAVDGRGVATLTLDRPDRHNAFDDALIAELTAALHRLGGDPEVRAVVLASSGRSFSAGADLEWMRRMARHSFEANLADAAGLAALQRSAHQSGRYSQCRNQPWALSGVMVRSAEGSSASSASMLRAARVRKCAFSLAQHGSIGLKSGE